MWTRSNLFLDLGMMVARVKARDRDVDRYLSSNLWADWAIRLHLIDVYGRCLSDSVGQVSYEGEDVISSAIMS